MCLFSRGGAQSWGELAGEGGGDSEGKEKKRKAQEEEQWKGRCSKVPVVSQPEVHALITDVAWGEWRTNSGSWARWGLLIMRFELTFNPNHYGPRVYCCWLLTGRDLPRSLSWILMIVHARRSWQQPGSLCSAFCLSVPGQTNEFKERIQNNPPMDTNI